MKIAIPSNDGINIFKRTGRAEKFVISEISENTFKIIGSVVNSHSHDHDDNHSHEEHEHSHNDLVKTIEGCDYLLVNMIGKHLKTDMDNSGIKIFKSSFTIIEDALLDFISKNSVE